MGSQKQTRNCGTAPQTAGHLAYLVGHGSHIAYCKRISRSIIVCGTCFHLIRKLVCSQYFCTARGTSQPSLAISCLHRRSTALPVVVDHSACWLYKRWSHVSCVAVIGEGACMHRISLLETSSSSSGWMLSSSLKCRAAIKMLAVTCTTITWLLQVSASVKLVLKLWSGCNL